MRSILNKICALYEYDISDRAKYPLSHSWCDRCYSMADKSIEIKCLWVCDRYNICTKSYESKNNWLFSNLYFKVYEKLISIGIKSGGEFETYCRQQSVFGVDRCKIEIILQSWFPNFYNQVIMKIVWSSLSIGWSYGHKCCFNAGFRVE